MFVVQIDFSHPTNEFDVDAVEWLLATWYKNGQLIAYPRSIARLDTGLRTTGSCLERDSLSDEHANSYVRRDMAALRDAGVTVNTSVVGVDTDDGEACACKTTSDFLLYTGYLTIESPLRCLTCFGQIPLYQVPPIAHDEYLDLVHWQADYQACDTLQMHCTVGERFGENQLADVTSALSRLGRSQCEAIEKLTGRRCYYFLRKTRGRSAESEKRRPCPGCGGAWALAEPLHGRFDFRCDECRLLGDVATLVSNR